MKNFISNACCFCKELKINEHYDCKTEIKCGKKEEPCFAVACKGDFTVTPVQILAASAIVAGIMLTASAVCMVKRKK